MRRWWPGLQLLNTPNDLDFDWPPSYVAIHAGAGQELKPKLVWWNIPDAFGDVTNSVSLNQKSPLRCPETPGRNTASAVAAAPPATTATR